MDLTQVSYRRIMHLAFPIIISQLGQITVGLVDNIMIGQIGTIELAAAAFVNNIFNLAIFFGTGVTFIITPLIGEAIGKKKQTTAGILKNSLIINSIIGVLIVGLLLLTHDFFPHMGQEAEVIKNSSGYFLLLTISYVPFIIFNSFKQFAEGTGDTKSGMQIIIVGNIVNIFGNYMYIFGKFGAPELGLNGAAIGTILSRIFMMLAFYGYFGLLKKYKTYTHGFKSAYIDFKLIKKIGKKGSVLGLQMLIEAGAFGFAGIMIGWLGAPGLAAHQIVISLSTIGFMVYHGMGSATTILISQSFGSRSKTKMKIQVKRAIFLTIPLSLIASIFFFSLRNYLPLIFTDDPDVIRISSTLLIILSLFQLPDALQIIYAAAVRALADVKIPALLLFISFFIICLPTGYFLAFKLNLKQQGLWISFPIGLYFTFLFLRFRFNKLISKI